MNHSITTYMMYLILIREINCYLMLFDRNIRFCHILPIAFRFLLEVPTWIPQHPHSVCWGSMASPAAAIAPCVGRRARVRELLCGSAPGCPGQGQQLMGVWLMATSGTTAWEKKGLWIHQRLLPQLGKPLLQEIQLLVGQDQFILKDTANMQV